MPFSLNFLWNVWLNPINRTRIFDLASKHQMKWCETARLMQTHAWTWTLNNEHTAFRDHRVLQIDFRIRPDQSISLRFRMHLCVKSDSVPIYPMLMSTSIFSLSRSFSMLYLYMRIVFSSNFISFMSVYTHDSIRTDIKKKFFPSSPICKRPKTPKLKRTHVQ